MFFSIFALPLISIAAALHVQEPATPSAEDLAKASLEELLTRGDLTSRINGKASLLFYGEALRRDPDNLEALCRRARLRMAADPKSSKVDWARAAGLFLEKLKMDPGNAGIRTLLLREAYEAQGKDDHCLTGALLQVNPDDVDGLFCRAACGGRKGRPDFEKALKILGASIKDGATGPACRRVLEAVDRLNPLPVDRADLLFLCDQVLAWDPDSLPGLVARWRIHEKMSWAEGPAGERSIELADADRARATALLDARIEKEPGDVNLRLQRFDLALDDGVALKDATAIIEISPKDSAAWLRRAEYMTGRGRKKDALSDFTRAIELDPENLAAIVGRARANLEERRFEAAMEDFTRAIQLEPGEPVYYSYRAACYMKLAEQTKNDDLIYKAVIDHVKASRLDPKYGGSTLTECIRVLKSRALSPEGRLAALTRLIEMDPTVAKFYEARAKEHSIQGKQVEAVADIKRAIHLAPDNAELRNQIWTFYKVQNPKIGKNPALLRAAYEDVTKQAAAEPGNEQTWRPTRACILTWMGRETEALADRSRIIELAPRNAYAWALRAETFLHFDRKDQAIADLSKAIEISPADEFLRRERNKVCLAAGAHALVIEDCDFLLNKHPGNPELTDRRNVARANLEFRERLFREASQDIEENPQDPKAYMKRARLFTSMRKWDRVLDDYSKAVDLSPPASVEALVARALAFESMGEWEKSLPDWDRVIDRAPGHADARIRRAAHRTRRGEHARAIEDYSFLIQEEPKVTKHLRSRAECHLALGHADQAIADYAKAVEVNPLDTAAWLSRGAIHRDRKDLDRALADFRAAREVEFNSPEAAAALASVYAARGVTDWAPVELEALIAAGSRRPDVLAERGYRRSKQGDWAGAEADFSAALAGKPGWRLAHHNRLVARVFLKKFDEALVDADHLIHFAPQDGEAYKIRARVYWDWGKHSMAMTDYRKAMEVAPGDPGIRVELESLKAAMVQYEIEALNTKANGYWYKDWERAINLYTQALHTDPGNETILCNRAYAVLYSGRTTKAGNQFESILKSHPDSARAKAGVEEVRVRNRPLVGVDPTTVCSTCSGHGRLIDSRWNYTQHGPAAWGSTARIVDCGACCGAGLR